MILGIAILTGTSSLFGWAASRTSRQITFRALRRSHYGSGPSRGGPGEIIAVPFSLTAYRFLLLWLTRFCNSGELCPAEFGC